MTGSLHEPSTMLIFETSAQDPLIRRVRGEYYEMPGMRLTLEQAMRMWMLDRETCAHVLQSLIAAGFLAQDLTGRYIRAHAGY